MAADPQRTAPLRDDDDNDNDDQESDGGADRCVLAYVAADGIPTAVLEAAHGIRHLDLTATALRSVKCVWFFPRLVTLVLDNNALAALTNFPKLPTLRTLWLNNNRIEDLNGALDDLEGRVPALQYFSLLGNPACPCLASGVTSQEQFRYRVYTTFRLGPQLRFLDATLVTPAEAALAEAVDRVDSADDPARTEPPAGPGGPDDGAGRAPLLDNPRPPGGEQ
eukprot:TRINITY_DN11500_c0_g1_i1.p2 TRINITY_DN11500_c0_g1~~TRINITY_DN11500_c0_g1_i1.p2  ORF type:complete len:222 (-),score=74.59 TRINITY_DN11500_c0_g1_i1:136-801(-)